MLTSCFSREQPTLAHCIYRETESWSIGLSLDRYCYRLSVMREVWTFKIKSVQKYRYRSIRETTAIKVSSILLPIPRHERIADTDTTKVSSIASMSISIFDVNNLVYISKACTSILCGYCRHLNKNKLPRCDIIDVRWTLKCFTS